MRIIAFDLDGTLVDCKTRQMAVLRVVLRGLGVPKLDLERIWVLKREGMITRDAVMQEGIHPEKASLIHQRWQSQVENWPWLALDVPFRDTLEVLEAVSKANIKVAVVTARQFKSLAFLQIRALGLSPYVSMFEAVDPSFAVANKAEVLKSWRVDAFIGDTEKDFQAATMAKVPFVGLSRGQRTARFLSSYGVENVRSSLSEALCVLGVRCGLGEGFN